MPGKSTEIAITRIPLVLLSNLNNKYGSILALLDLSDTFDTIDHNIFLSRISEYIGIIGTAHKWLKSFIHSYPPSYLVNIIIKTWSTSRIRPRIYSIQHLDPSSTRHNLQSPTKLPYLCYIQLYLSCNDNPSESPNIIYSAIDTIHKWLSNNSLAFNPGKTEALFLHLLYRNTTIDSFAHHQQRNNNTILLRG